jgi:uncharacterized membrane protein YcgQ (UPF0703/DUF1980 family)
MNTVYRYLGVHMLYDTIQYYIIYDVEILMYVEQTLFLIAAVVERCCCCKNVPKQVKLPLLLCRQRWCKYI